MRQHEKDVQWMRLALAEAVKAQDLGEVPVGAVMVCGDGVVSVGHNTRELRQNALGHAEISAIDAACQALGRWRLEDCTLYVTLEPCSMCAGAIVNARVARVVYGAADPRAGCFGGALDLSKADLGHAPRLCAGVLETECRSLLDRFFAQMRQKIE